MYKAFSFLAIFVFIVLALFATPYETALAASASLTNNTPGYADASTILRTVTVTTADIPAGELLTNVTIAIDFHKIPAGSCTEPDEIEFGGSYNVEIGYILTSPAGTNVRLVKNDYRQPDGTSTYTGNGPTFRVVVTFDDAAAALVGTTNGGIPENGTFRPEEALSAFNGQDPQGTWTLTINDDVAADYLCFFSFTLNLSTDIPPTITSAASASVAANDSFNHTFTATGNPLPTFSYSDENLPPGVTRIGDILSGTPTAPGSYSVKATASNGVSPDAVQVFEITVTGDAPAITSAAAGFVEQFTPFSHTFMAVGDPAPTLTYSSVNLPPGITRTGDTLSGTPTINGEFSITVTASNGIAPDAVQVFILTVGGLPVPPPTPLCEDHNFSEDGVVRSSTADVFGHAINCRVLYQNGAPTQWLGSDLYNGGSIGVEGIFDLGVWTAIDIFSPNGLTYFNGGAVFCLKGSGYLIWLAANEQPRHAEIIGSYQVPEFPGFTCATLFEPGTLVLVTQNPVR